MESGLRKPGHLVLLFPCLGHSESFLQVDFFFFFLLCSHTGWRGIRIICNELLHVSAFLQFVCQVVVLTVTRV